MFKMRVSVFKGFVLQKMAVAMPNANGNMAKTPIISTEKMNTHNKFEYKMDRSVRVSCRKTVKE